MRFSTIWLCVAMFGMAIGLADARAQTFPSRTITLVIPFAPGGSNSIVGRVIADMMSQLLGESIVVDNRPGAGGTVGTRAVARSEPDGYTILLSFTGTLAIAPSLYRNAGYDPRKDFAPIGLIGSYQQVQVVHPSVPVHSVADVLALAKKEPGKLTFATAGVRSGSHLSAELFAAMADIKLTHVPYRGTGAMQGDLVGGHVAMSITTLPSVIAAVRGGLLRAVAVTDTVRSPMLPDLPTVDESGVPGYAAVIHYGMVTTAGTDPAIVKRLNAELQAALASEEVRGRIAEEGGAPLPGSPEDQGRDIDAEETKWGTLIRKLGLKAE